MKYLFIIPFLVASCTVQHGKDQTSYPDGRVNIKSHLYASLGSKAKGLANSPEGSEILELDDSISARNIATAAVSAYSAYGLLAAKESDNALSASNYAQGAKTDRTKIVTEGAVQKAGIKADVAKEALKVAP
jgi:hypothetical protein